MSEGVPEVVAAGGIVGVDLEGAVGSGECPLGVASTQVCPAQIEVRPDLILIDLDFAVRPPDDLVHITEVLDEQPDIAVVRDD